MSAPRARLELAATGRRRSPATMPGYLSGRPPRNKGLRYPADPPRVEEIIAVMRAAGPRAQGDRVRGLIVVLWRAGLRIQEAPALTETDLDERHGALLVRHGKGDKRREVGMDNWGWEHQPLAAHRTRIPSERSSASSTDRHGDGRRRQPQPAPSFGGSPPQIINAVHRRRAPMMPASAGLRL